MQIHLSSLVGGHERVKSRVEELTNIVCSFVSQHLHDRLGCKREHAGAIGRIRHTFGSRGKIPAFSMTSFRIISYLAHSNMRADIRVGDDLRFCAL